MDIHELDPSAHKKKGPALEKDPINGVADTIPMYVSSPSNTNTEPGNEPSKIIFPILNLTNNTIAGGSADCGHVDPIKDATSAIVDVICVFAPTALASGDPNVVVNNEVYVTASHLVTSTF